MGPSGRLRHGLHQGTRATSRHTLSTRLLRGDGPHDREAEQHRQGLVIAPEKGMKAFIR